MVISKLCEHGVPPDEAMEAVQCLGAEIVPYSVEQALRAGELRPVTKVFGMSLGIVPAMPLAVNGTHPS